MVVDFIVFSNRWDDKDGKIGYNTKEGRNARSIVRQETDHALL